MGKVIKIIRFTLLHVWTSCFFVACNTYLSNKAESNYKYFKQYDRAAENPQILETKQFYSEKRCLLQCTKHGNDCKAIDLMELQTDSIGTIIECKMMRNIGKLIYADNIWHVSKIPLYCSQYCNSLNNFNICGNCECIETCERNIPYYCKCSQELSPTPSSCQEIINENQRTASGIYNVQHRSDVANNLFCKIDKKSGIGSPLVFRGINLINAITPVDTLNGDESIIEDLFIIPDYKIDNLLTAGYNSLSIEYVQSNNERYILEYSFIKKVTANNFFNGLKFHNCRNVKIENGIRETKCAIAYQKSVCLSDYHCMVCCNFFEKLADYLYNGVVLDHEIRYMEINIHKPTADPLQDYFGKPYLQLGCIDTSCYFFQTKFHHLVYRCNKDKGMPLEIIPANQSVGYQYYIRSNDNGKYIFASSPDSNNYRNVMFKNESYGKSLLLIRPLNNGWFHIHTTDECPLLWAGGSDGVDFRCSRTTGDPFWIEAQ